MSPAKRPITLLQEIQEQPALLGGIAREAPEKLPALVEKIPPARHVIGLAEGSSKHVLEMALPFLEQWMGLPVSVLSPDLLEQRLSLGKACSLPADGINALFEGALVIVVSQSGETGSVLRVLDQVEQHLNRQQFTVLTVTNREASTLATRYGNALPIGAGEEQSIAATKTMTSSLYWLLWWAFQWAKTHGTLPSDSLAKIQEELVSVPQALSIVSDLDIVGKIRAFTQKLIEVNHFVLLSKGVMTQMLPEVGLKLTETSSNIVYTDNTESFKHGPKVILSGVNEHHPNTVYVVPPTVADAEALYKDIRFHFWPSDANPAEDEPAYESDRVFFIRFDNGLPVPQSLIKGLSIAPDRILTLPPSPGVLASLIMGLGAFQVMSYHLALLKGESPDNPMLEKAVVS